MIRARLSALVVAALIALPCAASAQSLQDFEIARQAYDERDYARAVQYFEELVGTDPPRLSSPVLVVESRRLLGSAYLYLGRRDAAIHQFELLLRQEPDHPPLDPLRFPAAVQELFNNVRERLRAEARAVAERERLERELAAERERSRQLLAIADSEVLVDVENSRWAALIPLGVGQFLNGDDGLGWFFFLSEAACVIAAFVTAGIHESVLAQVPLGSTTIDDPRFDQANDYLLASAIGNWVSLGALGVLGIAGVVEAQVAFRPSRSVRHRRPVPDELREGLPGTEEEVAPPPAAPAVSVIPLGLRF